MLKKLDAASNLYEDFSGHRAATVENNPHIKKGGVFLKVGTCDFLTLANGQQIKFKAKSALLSSTYDGLQFHITGDGVKPAPYKNRAKIVEKVKAIGYTTKRDGVTERYIHTFKAKARPQLLFLTRNHIQSLGGAFDFTELGFVDRK